MRALVLRHVHAKAEIHDLSLGRIRQRLSLRPDIGTAYKHAQQDLLTHWHCGTES